MKILKLIKNNFPTKNICVYKCVPLYVHMRARRMSVFKVKQRQEGKKRSCRIRKKLS